MADTPRRRYSDSPSPRRRYGRSRSRSRSASRSRSPSKSRSPPRRDSSKDDVVNPGNNLYVTGLSARVVEKDLEEHFSQEGKVSILKEIEGSLKIHFPLLHSKPYTLRNHKNSPIELSDSDLTNLQVKSGSSDPALEDSENRSRTSLQGHRLCPPIQTVSKFIGQVVDCRIVVDPRTRESRGFGFVTMDTLEDAERCVKYLNRSTLEGRIITVEKAKRKRARTPTPGSYLGVRAAVRPRSYGGRFRERDRDRDSYSSRRSPHYSPYRGSRERDYDRDGSPYYSGRSYRRERSRSPVYSPYRR